MVRQFTKDVKIVPILSYASGTSDRTSKVIDTLGFDAVEIEVHLAAVHDSAVADIYLQHADAASDADTLTSGADVATSSQTISGTGDNKVMVIEVHDFTKRFLQLVVNNDATNATAQSAIAHLFRSKDSVPVTHATGSGTSGGSAAVVTPEVIIHPVSGTK